MSRVDLDELENLHQSTTPGPWWDSPVMAAGGSHTIRGGPSDWRGFDGSLGGDTRPIARIVPALAEDGTSVNEYDADTEFIVQAHRLWPVLVAELRAAREAHDALVSLHDKYDGLDYRLRGQLWRILATWDGVVGS